MEEGTLHQYLVGLSAIMNAVRTGEDFDQVMEWTMDQERREEVA